MTRRAGPPTIRGDGVDLLGYGAHAWAVTAPIAGGADAGCVRDALALVLGGATLGVAYVAVGVAVGARDVRALVARLRRR